MWVDLESWSSLDTWCILGDFNTIKQVFEADGGDSSWDIGMSDFNDCLVNIGVDDIRSIGPQHTWWNCQVNNPIHRKLDRAMGNSS